MSYKVKNAIYLTLVLLLVCGFVYWQHKKLTEQIEPLKASLAEKNGEIASLLPEFKPDPDKLEWLDKKVTHMENWTLEYSKFFLSEDTSRITWEYLQEIVKRFDENFQFNFATVTNRNQTDYTISGQVKVIYLYVFINYLEKLGALYTIENIIINHNFHQTDDGPANDINFNISIRPWVDKAIGKNLHETPLRRINYDYIMKDPFRPTVHVPMRDPAQEQFTDYEPLKLIGHSGNTGYFSSENRTVIQLNPMQRVAYGYFSHIDSKNNRAVFRINKTGLYENIYIELE